MIKGKGVHVKLVFIQNPSTKSARKFLYLEPELKLQLACPKCRIQKIPQASGPNTFSGSSRPSRCRVLISPAIP